MKNHAKLAVMIGRWQPFHNGHWRNLKIALQSSEHVLVLVCSSNLAQTIKNPFTSEQRKQMILDTIASMTPEEVSEVGFTSHKEIMDSVTIVAANDYLYEDNRWLSEIQSTISSVYLETFPEEDPGTYNRKNIAIVGHDKDESTYYLRMFPRYSTIDTGAYSEIGEVPINATHVRKMIFENHLTSIKSLVPSAVFDYILKAKKADQFYQLYEEYQHVADYKALWAHTPYPVTFNTVDAVVVEAGHVLLIKRKFAPGKGLWALPGGFINVSETSENAVIRELKEETGLKVPEIVLKKAITYRKRFDHPDRSLRGRTITEAFLIELSGSGDGKLPRVKGSDDAEDARFFEISEVMNMSTQLFEDHFSIISMMLSRSK